MNPRSKPRADAAAHRRHDRGAPIVGHFVRRLARRLAGWCAWPIGPRLAGPPAARRAGLLAYSLACLLTCLLAGTPAGNALAAEASASAKDASPVDRATLQRVRDAAMSSDWAWQHLAELTDSIGPRLSGSPQLELAVARLAQSMRELGAVVRLQAVKVPHWVRGEESCELVSFAGQGAGLVQHLHLTALGGSGATDVAGLTARVVVAHDFAELQRRAGEVPGSVVVFESRFDQHLADHGRAGAAYGQAGTYRFVGPSTAAALGAAAVLVRSIGGADYRLPHTGATLWKSGQAPIPAAALAAEDADLIDRLAARGPIQMHLVLTPRVLPEADSNNVIADWPGREKPEEVVLVSGHLDSWDLGTGATDDGTGVTAAAAVIAVLQQLDVHARRTIRFVAWTNEENGSRGSAAYFASVEKDLARQVAAIESDAGAGRTLGITAAVTADSLPGLRAVTEALAPLGASVLERRESELGADIAPLQAGGVPGFAPLVDTQHYFDYHHTAADTLDKVDPHFLRTQVAALAALAYFLAELPEPLPRYPVGK